MSTAMTIKGQVTIPKEVREATGIHPGDRVVVDVGAGGAVVIRKIAVAPDRRAVAASLARIDNAIGAARAVRTFDGSTTDALMRLLRADS
jgi:AbrB family looped-hinge helix DNA binding protein